MWIALAKTLLMPAVGRIQIKYGVEKIDMIAVRAMVILSHELHAYQSGTGFMLIMCDTSFRYASSITRLAMEL